MNYDNSRLYEVFVGTNFVSAFVEIPVRIFSNERI